MLITVPRSIMLDPSEVGDMNQLLTFGLDAPGLGGLGQDVGDQLISDDPTVGLPTDTGSYVSTSDIPGYTGLVPIDSSALPTGVTSSSSGSTVAQDISALGPALAAAAKGITAASGPYAIPGTSYIYNPATGQILLNGAAVGTYNPATGAISAISTGLLSYLPLIVIAVVGVMLVSSMGGKR
jgi:hypothetical protein